MPCCTSERTAFPWQEEDQMPLLLAYLFQGLHSREQEDVGQSVCNGQSIPIHPPSKVVFGGALISSSLIQLNNWCSGNIVLVWSSDHMSKKNIGRFSGRYQSDLPSE
jgi:hypothetical protein